MTQPVQVLWVLGVHFAGFQTPGVHAPVVHVPPAVHTPTVHRPAVQVPLCCEHVLLVVYCDFEHTPALVQVLWVVWPDIEQVPVVHLLWVSWPDPEIEQRPALVQLF